jgi:hypothetical protein
MARIDNAIPEWRQFEKLVALIECHLVPQGATVKSPDRIRDRVTGQLREVDVSIRYQVGSVPILITIECRERSSEEDVTWIEQLVSKRDSIGASATVAVSCTGFTKPALEKARFHGIEIRLLRDVSEDSIREWARKMELIVVGGRFAIGNLFLYLKPTPGNPLPELRADVFDGCAKNDVEFKFIRRMENGELISVRNLLEEIEQKAGSELYDLKKGNFTLQLPPQTSVALGIRSKYPSLFEDVPINGEPIKKTWSWQFEANEATVETDKGPAELERLDVEFHVVRQAYPFNIGRLLSYEDESGTGVNVEERELALNGVEPILAIISGKTEGSC